MKNLMFLSGIFLLIACGSGNTQSTIPNDTSSDGVIDAESFKKGIADINAIQLVDVRTPEEFSAGAIPGVG